MECGEELALFPKGAVPGEIPGAYGKEKWVHENGETHVYNVSVPTIKRFCPPGNGTKKVLW